MDENKQLIADTQKPDLNQLLAEKRERLKILEGEFGALGQKIDGEFYGALSSLLTPEELDLRFDDDPTAFAETIEAKKEAFKAERLGADETPPLAPKNQTGGINAQVPEQPSQTPKVARAERVKGDLATIDSAKLTDEQRLVREVYLGEAPQTELRAADATDLIALEYGSKRQGARKILLRHGGKEATGGLTPREMLEIGDVIRNGKIATDSFSETANSVRYGYDLERDGVRYRVVIEEFNDGKKAINYYSNRNIEAEASRGGPLNQTSATNTIPSTAPKSQAPTEAAPTPNAELSKTARVSDDIDKDLQEELPPFIKSELQLLKRAITNNDREAVQSVATKAAEAISSNSVAKEAYRKVYERAFEALSAIPKEAKPLTKTNARPPLPTYQEALKQVNRRKNESKATPQPTNTNRLDGEKPAPQSQARIERENELISQTRELEKQADEI
ncbi:MAG: hypothetical protein LBF86_05930, partial [Helicobacteraceae bacterium]|nr:hypothetical protein [Helicobacteraceae bacterium]